MSQRSRQEAHARRIDSVPRPENGALAGSERLACKGCHTISGEGGRIGLPLEGIADRLQPSFVFDIISDPGRVVPEAGIPGQHLRPRDARRVASYLRQMSGTGRTAEYSSLLDAGHPSLASTRAVTSEPGNGSEDDLAAGAARYGRHCASCRGDGFNAPYLVPQGRDPRTSRAHQVALRLRGTGVVSRSRPAMMTRSIVCALFVLAACSSEDRSQRGIASLETFPPA